MYTSALSNKNLKAILITFLCSVWMVQFADGQKKIPQPVHYQVAPGTVWPSRIHHRGNSGSHMKDMVNDTSDILDYNTYDEIMAANQQISFNGSWNTQSPSLYASELTSLINVASADNLQYSYAQVIFDSLAFADYTVQSVYSIPRTGSIVTLDSMGMFIGISGDTVSAHGTMANDSLVISIYPVIGNTVSPNPVKTIINAGYNGLAPFFIDPGYLKYVPLTVGQQFNIGESFAIKVTYLNKDSSSHCLLSYTYPDSCGTITIQGMQYSSPAYPSVFQSSSSYGEIDSVAPTAATVTVINNSYKYDLSSYGVPANCSYVYVQNWEILSYVSVKVKYGTQIQANTSSVCNGSSVSLNALVFGTDSPSVSYNWAVSSGILSGANAANAAVSSTNNSNITVTLTVNDGSGDVKDSLVLINCHLNVNAGYNQTVCTGSTVILTPSITGGTPPYSYQWQAVGSTLSCQNCVNPSATIAQNSAYTVTVTDAVQGTATASVSYTLNAFTNQQQISIANTGIACNTNLDTTTVTVTGGTTPYTFNWGNGHTSNGSSPGIFNYELPAATYILAVTDAQNCVTTVFDTVIYAGPSVTFAQALQPGCPNSPTGEIDITVTGGSAPYNYLWSNGAQSANLINASSGSYGVTVTDAHGCAGSLSYALNSVRDFDYYIFMNATNANCNLSGLVTTTVNGGVLPYSYQWSNGATTASIRPVVPGSYSLTVTDSLGCNAMGQTYISNYCQSIISGNAFYDSTGHCNIVNSTPVGNMYVVASASNGNNYFGTTDLNGNYSLQVNDTGTFTLYADQFYDGCGNVTFCGNTNRTVFLPVLGDSANNVNIGIDGASGFDLGIHPGWTSANPGFTKQYWIYYYNASPTPYVGQATITFIYDPRLIYTNTDLNPAPVNNTATHTLTWTINSILPSGEWEQIDADFQVPTSLNLNDILQSDFRITPSVGDCDSSDNHYVYSETVVGSHDPNEKTVSPAGPVTESDSVLTYTIHFQNTGTDSTHFVIIKDTLSPYLNPASVRNIASSDKYSAFSVSGNGILTWTFNPLRIVDSLTNPSGSKRFIMFTVKKKASLPIGTHISNTASIYFDYNDAVVTNTVTDTEAVPVYIFEVSNNDNISIKAFPNPFSDVTNIVVTGLNEKFGFELYDVTGRLQQTITSIDNNQFQVHKGQMAKGVYLYRIIVANKPAAYGKLVVE